MPSTKPLVTASTRSTMAALLALAGLEIPAGDNTRATVTVQDSVITENSASPIGSVLPRPEQEPFWPHCPDGSACAGRPGGRHRELG